MNHELEGKFCVRIEFEGLSVKPALCPGFVEKASQKADPGRNDCLDCYHCTGAFPKTVTRCWWRGETTDGLPHREEGLAAIHCNHPNWDEVTA